jgi:hypothetical protein
LAQALLILLIGQLHSFGFDPITSPKTAGDTFTVTVIALDSLGNPISYNGGANVYVPYSYPVKPDTYITFNNSSISRVVLKVSLALDTIALWCVGGGASGTSNQFQVQANSPMRLFSVLPGQAYEPGYVYGREGSAVPQEAGASFNINLYMTDAWFNRVTTSFDSLRITSSDPFRPPFIADLINGQAQVPYSFRQSGNQTIYSRDLSNGSIRSDTSSSISIYPSTYSRLLVMLPGETYLPGDTTTIISSTPGKSDAADPQYVEEDFDVRVLAVDSMWNETSVSGNSIRLSSTFPFSNPADQPLNGGEAQFLINYTTIGANQDLTAQDMTAGAVSYLNRLDILAKTDSMDIQVDKDTILAGDTTRIRVTLFDRNDDVIAQRPVSFHVISGHGEIPSYYDTTYTNEQGVAFSYFTCGAGFFDELDTIGVTADDTTFATVCFIEFPDSMVMEGKIIAYPNPIGIRADRTRLIYYLQQSCDITYVIYDPFGNLVHRENITRGNPGARVGVNYLTWDGRNDKGHRVASGLYYIMLKGYINTSVFLDKRIRVGVIW